MFGFSGQRISSRRSRRPAAYGDRVTGRRPREAVQGLAKTSGFGGSSTYVWVLCLGNLPEPLPLTLPLWGRSYGPMNINEAKTTLAHMKELEETSLTHPLSDIIVGKMMVKK